MLCQRFSIILGSLLLAAPAAADPKNQIDLLRVPDGGIEPRVALDEKGGAHLICYRGSEDAGDIYYAPWRDEAFAAARRVARRDGSAIALGTIRGAQLAVGKGGRVHVAWNGAKRAEPRAPGGETPMLYARLADDGASFEEERNLITKYPGLDGGGAVAADGEGNVYVLWHAFGEGARNEENRRLYVARSRDEGKTFEPEFAAFKDPIGCCACCGMAAFADRKGRVYSLFRSATQVVNRDMTLLIAKDGRAFKGGRLDAWEAKTCVMSTASFVEDGKGVIAAWETRKQVFFTRIDGTNLKPGKPTGAPGQGENRKHPIAATNSRGELLLVWTEKTGWNKGGDLCWQLFDAKGKPSADAAGRREGAIPPWSFAAAFARPDGRFVILH